MFNICCFLKEHVTNSVFLTSKENLLDFNNGDKLKRSWFISLAKASRDLTDYRTIVSYGK